MIRQTKFPPPPRRQRREVRSTEILSPTLGFHGGEFAQNLAPGFSPFCQNVYARDGALRARSALTSALTTDLGGAVLGAVETFDVEGKLGAQVMSAESVLHLNRTNKEWSDLSYVPSAFSSDVTASLSDVLSGTSVDYFDGVCIYDSTNTQNLVVFSNGTNWIKEASAEDSTSTYSDFTHAYAISNVKSAEAITAVNDRLVLFNVLQEDGTRVPNQVQWSARGNVRSFQIADGAGAEVLASMRGSGTAAVRLKDFILLFTEQEIWRANPTLDDYAFRFERVSDRIGCPFPRTIVSTPYGAIFLGPDFEMYATDGVSVQPVGPAEQGAPSRVQKKLSTLRAAPRDRTFAIFNREERRYELYYPSAMDKEYCDAALYFNLDEQTYWPQTFSDELSFGIDRADVGLNETWNSLVSTWEELTFSWDEFGRAERLRRTEMFTSSGSIFVQDSARTRDFSGAIDARWRTHTPRLRDSMDKYAITEVWLDGPSSMTTSDVSFVYDGSARTAEVRELPHFMPIWSSASRYVELQSEAMPEISQVQLKLERIGRF